MVTSLRAAISSLAILTVGAGAGYLARPRFDHFAEFSYAPPAYRIVPEAEVKRAEFTCKLPNNTVVVDDLRQQSLDLTFTKGSGPLPEGMSLRDIFMYCIGSLDGGRDVRAVAFKEHIESERLLATTYEAALDSCQSTIRDRPEPSVSWKPGDIYDAEKVAREKAEKQEARARADAINHQREDAMVQRAHELELAIIKQKAAVFSAAAMPAPVIVVPPPVVNYYRW
jgi:hypothetical protein